MRTRAQAGEPEAFRELFDLHAKVVYNHAFRLVGSWSTAEDAVSLTFLEAWRLRERIDTSVDATLQPWLLGIATNVCRNVRRAARRYDGVVARLPAHDVVPDPAAEVASRLDSAEQLARVRKAMAMLRKSEREILALCVWAGLDYAEAAEALGLPVSTVRSRLSRVRQKLRKLVATGRLIPYEEIPELPEGGGQVIGDGEIAVRSTQENVR